MNGYNFTDRVRKVLQMAREEAARLHHEYVGTEHILLGLIREGEGVAAAVLTNLNVDLEEIPQKIEETVKKGKAAAAAGPELPYTSWPKKVIELALRAARDRNQSYGSREHAALALLGAEERSVLDRRAGGREDRHRRRTGPADRERPVPRCAEGPPRAVARHGGGDRRHQVPRPVRGAAQGDHQRDRTEPEHHPVHRRAAHAGGRGGGGGRRGRVQHVEAGAGARRAAVRRRVDAQRI